MRQKEGEMDVENGRIAKRRLSGSISEAYDVRITVISSVGVEGIIRQQNLYSVIEGAAPYTGQKYSGIRGLHIGLELVHL